MEQRYNVFFAGEIIDGYEKNAVREALAKLFNASEETLDRLFSGEAQLIKRECDRETALKYGQAMERAGARSLIRLARETTAGQTSRPPATPSAAEKIATLAAAPDAGVYDALRESAAGTAEPDTARPADTDHLDLCPDGTEVLRPEERSSPVAASIDTSALEVDVTAQRLSAAPPPAPPPPDTSHLSTAAVGESIPNLPPPQAPRKPDTSGIALAPEGTDFSDCRPPDEAPPGLDLSGIELAPPHAQLLTEQERRREIEQPPPDTDHIDLAD